MSIKRSAPAALLGATALCLSLAAPARAELFLPSDLVVSRSVYQDTGAVASLTPGQALPGGGTAVAGGSYPTVFQNNTVDGSFGVTSQIYLDSVNPITGKRDATLAVNPNQIVTSFSSKSELALNLSTDGHTISFAGYQAPIGALDISNANTPGIIEPGNPVTTGPAYRAISSVDANGNLTTTTTNAYPGNNPRAAILDNKNGQYLVAGNAGNGNGSPAVTNATGVQIVTPGQNATPGTGTTKVGNFNITQLGYPADKSAKDNNFRGETIFNNTLYVTKGSGSNGINTVYQVGNAGTLPTAANAANTPITVLPGFPTVLAKSSAASHPFGIFFANANTLYVADEGNQLLSDTAANNTNAGLQKWSLVNGTWQEDYLLTNGLNLDQQYTVAGLPTSLDPATDGLRNLTGRVNGDGTVTLYAITSTISANGDQGADPNKLVAITDTLSDMTALQASNESFITLETAAAGEVLRGVALAPVPEPASLTLLGGAFAALGFFRRKRG
jgi:hypothetical protein